jgi:dipeptidyl aminopeptidase/acylaminoacyl peptidase
MRFPLERFLNVRSANTPRFSPDGKRIAFLTNVTGVPQLWEVDRGGGWPDQRTFFSERVGTHEYAVAKPEIVFETDVGGNERFQLWHLANGGATLGPLTNAPDTIHSLGDWSRDGTRICFSANGRDPRFFDVFVRHMETGDVRKVYEQDGSNLAVGFSSDGRHVLVYRLVASFDQDLYLVDTETGEARHLTPHEGSVRYEEPTLAPDGRHAYALTDVGREFLAIARLDLRRLTWSIVQEEPWDIEHLAITLDGRLAAFVVNEGGVSRLRVMRLRDRSMVAEPALPEGWVTTLKWSPDGRHLAFTFESPIQNQDVWTLDVRRSMVSQVTRSSRAGIPAETFRRPERAEYATFDDRKIPAWWYRPPGRGPFPVIAFVHGGPESQTVANFNPLIQFFVNRGYAVLAPNVRGSAGYGKTYHHLDDIEKRMDSVADLKHGADWVRERSDVERDRVAVMGGSYGGFMVLASLSEYPEAWSAGVDVVGIANFVTFLQNTGPWRRRWRESEYGFLERDLAVLERISPIHKADRIRAPLFVIHGKNDPRVPLEETEQIVESVRARGGVVDFLVFEDEGHGLIKIPNRIRGYTAAVDFLDKHMGG